MGILVDQRNSGNIKIAGFEKFSNSLDEIARADFSARMLETAEPLIIQALDAEMIKHPGELQKSLKSTGINESPRGYYVAYRATGDSKNGGPSNPEKMIYLINREYIRERNGKSVYHIDKNGKKVLGYAIPAYDVISDAIRASESSIYSAMENEFNEILDEIWGND